MSATEKVVNALNVSKLILCNSKMLTSEMCVKIGQVINDAIDLLKEQEAVPPKEKAYAWRCGKCDEYLTAIQNHRIRYCPYCGQAVKWNDT